jgi:outer membrane biosynthesis protein TonB
MPKIDDPLGPSFERRLRATLNRVQPPFSPPRYQSVTAFGTLRTGLLRAAPLAAVGVAGLLLTAFAATGSPNPVIWTQNAASAITSITHQEPIPTAEPSGAPQEPARSSSQASSEQEKPEPPEPASSTEPAEKPEPAQPAEKPQPEPVRSTDPKDDH